MNPRQMAVTKSGTSVQSLSHVWLSVTPWTIARQAFLSITNSQSYSNSCSLSWWCHLTNLILCHPLLLQVPSIFPSIKVFSNESIFTLGGHSIGVSASASVLPMNIRDRLPLGWIGWISLQSKGLSRVFSNTTVQKHQFFGTQVSLNPVICCDYNKFKFSFSILFLA